MKPTRSILSKDFKYTNAASTDIRKTFERIRRQRAPKVEPGPHQVIAIKKREAKA